MSSLLFLASVGAMGLIIWWVLQNDKAGDDGITTGLLAMRERLPDGTEIKPKPKVQPGRPPQRRR